MATDSRRAVIGVDLGGTKIEAIVLAFDGEAPREVARERVATDQGRGYEAIVESTAALAEHIARGVGLDLAAVPIGVGMPGGIRRRDGLVKNSNTVCLN